MYLGAEASHFKQLPIAALEALRHPKSEILREMIFSSLPTNIIEPIPCSAGIRARPPSRRDAGHRERSLTSASPDRKSCRPTPQWLRQLLDAVAASAGESRRPLRKEGNNGGHLRAQTNRAPESGRQWRCPRRYQSDDPATPGGASPDPGRGATRQSGGRKRQPVRC